jgi:hypothetical protein
LLFHVSISSITNSSVSVSEKLSLISNLKTFVSLPLCSSCFIFSNSPVSLEKFFVISKEEILLLLSSNSQKLLFHVSISSITNSSVSVSEKLSLISNLKTFFSLLLCSSWGFKFSISSFSLEKFSVISKEEISFLVISS